MNIVTDIGLYHFLFPALFLFAIGLFGAIVSKHILKILISLEIMFCGVTLNVAAFATFCTNTPLKGNVLALFLIILSVVHIAVGAAVTVNIFKFKHTVNIEDIGELKG
ncbi:MAG: NADH-quinone oxidoreductase subunit NuoK [Candidatus Gastranaerophilaceae bacterium]